MNTATNHLLNIYMYAYRQSLLSDLNRETSPCIEQQGIQGDMAAQDSEGSAPHTAFTSHPLCSGNIVKEEVERCESWKMREGLQDVVS